MILIAAGVSSSDTNDTATESVSPTPETTTSAASSTVSDVVGADVDTASSELEAQGFDVRVKTKVTDDAAEDTVLSQSPAAGSSVESGHTIVLVVAESLPLVPNVVGDKVAKARSELKDAGFGVDVKQQESSKPKGTVIAQSPKGGTSAKPHRSVTLVVAKAPARPSCDPNYSGCLNPNAADYDCAGGSGDGPLYTGRVDVLGVDHYGLDSDGDGVGCE